MSKLDHQRLVLIEATTAANKAAQNIHGGDIVIFTDEIRPAFYWATIGIVLIINLVFALLLLGAETTSIASLDYKAMASSSSTSIVGLLLLGIFSRKFQDNIVHFRLRNVLPACSALDLAKADPRVNEAKFKVLGRVPPKGIGQNTWWYDNIYQAVKHTSEVKAVQKRYLLVRDAAFIQFIATLILVGLTIATQGPTNYIILGFGIYGMFALATRNIGDRFVQTAMAVWK